MPPQPGVFSLPCGSAQRARTGYLVGDMADMSFGVAQAAGGAAGPVYAHHGHATIAGPSSRTHGTFLLCYDEKVALKLD